VKTKNSSRRSTKIHRTATPIRIDGKLDEPAWFGAPPVGEFHFTWYKEGRKERTVAKAAVGTTRNLYVGHVCEDAHITAQHTETCRKIFSEDDCFEVIFAPDPTRPEVYFNIEWNVVGGVCRQLSGRKDRRSREPRSGTPREFASPARSSARSMTTATPTRRGRSKVAIPLKNFAKHMPHTPPLAGEHWKPEPQPARPGKTNLQYSQWSPADTPAPTLHTPHRFGRAVFSAKESPFDRAKGE